MQKLKQRGLRDERKRKQGSKGKKLKDKHGRNRN